MRKKRFAALSLAFVLAGCSAAAVNAAAEVSSGVGGDVVSDWISYDTEHIEGTAESRR